MKALAREEVAIIEEEAGALELLLREKLLKKHEKQAKSIFLEIRAGTGGEEAALFARDLFTMYMRYAETMRWKTELMSSSISDLGGFREVIMVIEGKEAYNMLQYESGVHRVQRVPDTEAQGTDPYIDSNRGGVARTGRARGFHIIPMRYALTFFEAADLADST